MVGAAMLPEEERENSSAGKAQPQQHHEQEKQAQGGDPATVLSPAKAETSPKILQRL